MKFLNFNLFENSQVDVPYDKNKNSNSFSILFISLCILVSGLMMGCSNTRPGKPRVLVFSKTAGYRHASIPDGKKAIQKLGQEHGFLVDTTEDASKFNEDNLKRYSAVIFLSTTHDVLNYRQQAAFERYIEAGGGYVGVHAASDTEYQWPWYHKLVGAYFKEHPKIQNATLRVHEDANFPVLDSLPHPWKRTDEWYDFRSVPKNVNVLVDIDESSYEGGTMGKNHPMVWYHKYDGGRSFYMELGHTKESYTEPNFLKLLQAGINYAIGNNEVLDYNKVTQKLVPDENRFSKKLLASDLDEPTEISVLPDLSILVAQRKGDIKFYNSATKEFNTVAHLDVYHHQKNPDTNGNVEMGLLGLKIDPHYSDNHWVYVYYSPTGSKSVDRLSRFKFENNQFDKSSEQIILEVPTQREMCCHTGGSIAFDANDNLYLSVGDNTTPFDEINPKTGKAYPINLHGFAPIDDRPGFDHFDDGRAAGNTNDLRGKILRIKMNKDGSYDIPDGNLFPKGTPKTKPEIYVMGDRNPYRISIDQHTGYLYWGEVGPDANNDSLKTRGPRGYDEVNQARKAGNFGWPFIIGDNYPYVHYNFATGESGAPYNPEHPVNDSRNNDGLDTLPPAQPAFIWYPYAKSDEFPSLGDGGRTAMAGPVYYVNDYPRDTRFPDYYDGKFFFYDWIRDWIKVATMNKQGDLLTIEPFMPNTDFHHISDMETGPDGRIYEVEYGTGWFTANPDAGLYVIDYNGGNRAPEVAVNAEKKSGPIPFTVHLSAEGTTDPDGDALQYEWNFGDGNEQTTDSPQVTHEYSKAGKYAVTLTAKDGKGAHTSSDPLNIYAGNEKPNVNISLQSNKTFYFPNESVRYKVSVQDHEDGSSDQSGFDKSRVTVKADYLSNGQEAEQQSGHLEQMATSIRGKTLMESSDCQSCHKIDMKSIGPSFTQVAKKYVSDPQVMTYLPKKIQNGGSGVWGETAMAAHPGLSDAEAQSIVKWILSLAGNNKGENSLPMSGSINPQSKFKLTQNGVVYLTASYTDKGADEVPSLVGTAHKTLRNPLVKSVSADQASNFSKVSFNGNELYVANGEDAWLKFNQISLENVRDMTVQYGVQQPVQKGWSLEVHLDSPDGTLLGKTTIGPGAKAQKPNSTRLRFTKHAGADLHDVYLVLHKQDSSEQSGMGLMSFKLQAR